MMVIAVGVDEGSNPSFGTLIHALISAKVGIQEAESALVTASLLLTAVLA